MRTVSRNLLVKRGLTEILSVRCYTAGYYTVRGQSYRTPKKVEQIPNFSKFWSKFTCMNIAEINCKKSLLDELIRECQLIEPSVPFHYIEKMFITQSSIATLMKRNLVISLNSVVNGLLSPLEPFPFDNNEIIQNHNILSIQLIRNTIEKQYLAWKYKHSLEDVEEILQKYKLCLYGFRSMANLRRNIDMLEKLPRSASLRVAEKIYHINQKPFNISLVENFQETLAGLNWQLFPQYCPKILHHSHQYILFIISFLREMNFTEKQIEEGLPLLHLSFPNICLRLNSILGNAELKKYRDHDKFLLLLSYSVKGLQDLVSHCKVDFLELTSLINVSSRNSTQSSRLITVNTILYHVNQFYVIQKDCEKLLRKHSKHKLTSEKQILETLALLKRKRFTGEEVAESITIVLYPSILIERTLAKIESESETLQRYGFDNGCVAEETQFFRYGTKQKQKILQLCLYYLEKPYHFSGDGVWGYEFEVK